MRGLRGVEIDAAAWAECTLPEHVTMRFVVRSERGAVLDESHSLEALQMSLAPRVKSAVQQVVKGAVERALDEARRDLLSGTSATPRSTVRDTSQPSVPNVPLNDWPEVPGGIIPASVENAGPHGMTVRGYPALVVDPQSSSFGARPVSFAVVAEPAEQVRDHRWGVIHMLAHTLALNESRVTSRWSGALSLALTGSPYPSTSALVGDLQLAAARNLADRWAQDQGTTVGEIRSRTQWEEVLGWARDRFEDEVFGIARISGEICTGWAALTQELKASTSIALLATVSDISAQLAALVPAGFIAHTPQEHLADLPRYISAARMRLEKAATNPHGDDALAWQIQSVTEKIARATAEAATHPYDANVARTLTQARWMGEELRVSLFAQQLGTHGKVSAKRIEKLLAQL